MNSDHLAPVVWEEVGDGWGGVGSLQTSVWVTHSIWFATRYNSPGACFSRASELMMLSILIVALVYVHNLIFLKTPNQSLRKCPNSLAFKNNIGWGLRLRNTQDAQTKYEWQIRVWHMCIKITRLGCKCITSTSYYYIDNIKHLSK